MSTKAKKIGITGGIGSGKSVFCEFLKEKSFVVLNADELAKELLAKDAGIKKKVITEFGDEAYKNEIPDKKYLAEKVFSDPNNVEKINSIIHPVVIKEIEKIFEKYSGTQKIIFVEAALIYEAEMDELFDYIVLVTADEKIREERKKKYDDMSAEEFQKRLNNQIPDSEKKKAADFVFENNGSKSDLRKKADLLLLMLSTKK